MTRLMYDSTSAADIPTAAALVAGYVDGWYRWSAADWARFPNALHVGIAVSAATNAGRVLDIETGDAFPWEAPGWVVMRRAAGADPTVYVNRSNWAATRTEFQHRGIPEPHYWLAAYDNIAEIPSGTVAKQYADSAMAGGHYDLSAVADYWPGVDTPGSIAGSEVRVGGLMLDPNDPNDAIVIQVAKDLYGGDAVHPKGWIRDLLEKLDVELLASSQGDGVRAKFSTLGGAVLAIKAEAEAIKAKLDATPAGTVDLTPLTTAIAALTTKVSGLTLKAQ